MPSNAVPILMYHQVSPQRVSAFEKYIVSPRAFATQMTWLRLAGYTTITLDRLLAHRQGQGSLPRRPVIITFDDGYQDCVDYAAPVLRAKGFTAIFYLVAGLMGKTSEWLLTERGLAFPLLDWAAARRLEAGGLQCGAHTLSHPRLAQLDAATCRKELAEARLVLEDQLGHAIHHLAYPFGSYNENVRALAIETGYQSACSVRIGLSPQDDDPWTLQRVPILGQDSLFDFICRLQTAQCWRDLVAGKITHVRSLRPKGVYPS